MLGPTVFVALPQKRRKSSVADQGTAPHPRPSAPGTVDVRR